ncbi:hypothetical protein Y1Q_0007705 [Alligator mississippiensis]|uniref:Uncharacterized protein n=1 Tax=Alligator mississippiensis TaxID=8496 RepID=A0A151N2C3_ALLMI|nr:hypothetical protein Y1Q_0007705 [Alligator mississippiensis]
MHSHSVSLLASPEDSAGLASSTEEVITDTTMGGNASSPEILQEQEKEQEAQKKKEAIQQKMEKELQEISDRYQKLLNNLREEADNDVSIIEFVLKKFEAIFSKIKNWFKS